MSNSLYPDQARRFVWPDLRMASVCLILGELDNFKSNELGKTRPDQAM